MRQKRVLVCDDDTPQYEILEGILQREGYDVKRSADYRSVVAELTQLWPVHLLILDLGFPSAGRDGVNRDYIGQECIPDVAAAFPNLKIMIFSDVGTRADTKSKGFEITRELFRHPQVVGVLGPTDTAVKIAFEINTKLGTSNWLRKTDGELWFLHASDLQFGGDGLPDTAVGLATKIAETVDAFVHDDRDGDEKWERNYPALAFITGDLTEHGRPSEIETANKFLGQLSRQLGTWRADLFGVMSDQNCILIPGNHDLNWDVSRAQNLHPIPAAKNGEPSTFQYKPGAEHLRPDLDFIHRFAWMPFGELASGVPDLKTRWWWDPGFAVVSLREELRLVFVALNSSRWEVDHARQRAIVPETVWLAIKAELDRVDPKSEATRVLFVHHPITEAGEAANRLTLGRATDDFQGLVRLASRTCGFSIVCSGHLHSVSARELETGSSRRLVSICAGTLRSHDRPAFRNPTFNLIRLGDPSPETNKFESLVTYTFHWDGTTFGKYAVFDDGMRAWKAFSLAVRD